MASLQDSSAPWRSCIPVASLAVATNTSDLIHATAFTLSWRQINETGDWGWLSTQPLFADNTIEEIQTALEQELGVGQVRITRSPYLPSNRTYTWLITFLKAPDDMHLLQATTVHMYNRYNGNVSTAWVNPPCERVVSRVHLFSRLAPHAEFTEDLYAYPNWDQPAAMFGHALALSNYRLIVGAPNADTPSNIHNAGAVLVYSLDLLKTQLSVTALDVTEGDTATLMLEWRPSFMIDDDAIEFMVSTLDSNPNPSLQEVIRRAFAIDIHRARERRFDTLVDMAGVTGTAMGRTWANNQTSMWSQGIYDYRAVSDYFLLDKQLWLSENEASTSFDVHTTADRIHESPDETVNIAINVVGLWPSPLGRLHGVLTIRDNGDAARAFQDNQSPLLLDLDTAPSTADIVAFVDKMESSFVDQEDELGKVYAVEKRLGIVAIGKTSFFYALLDI